MPHGPHCTNCPARTVRRADKRSPRQIAIQQLTNQIDLPDRDLCQSRRNVSVLPAAPDSRFWRCAWAYLAEDGTGRVIPCAAPAEWRAVVPGLGVRNGCTSCVAKAIRAQLFLTRRRYEREEANR